MIDAVLQGLALGLILALSMGPVIFTIIKQSLNNGKQGGFSFVAGVWLSDILLVVMTNAFSEFVLTLMEYKKSVGVVGSAFLLTMGIFYVFFKKIKIHAHPEGTVSRFRKRDMAKIFSSGFLINSLNPNVMIFWLGTAGTLAINYSLRQRILIFSICLGFNFAADVFKIVMAGKLRKKLTLHNLSVINKISGTILIGFGIALLVGTLFFSENPQ